MDDTNSKTTKSSDATDIPDSRRGILTALLGGIGVSALSACVKYNDGSEAPIGDVTQANTLGVSIAVVETVLGAAPGANRTGDLATATPSTAGVGTNVVLALGCLKPGDGGGGLFVWERIDGGDDGGTIIVPSSPTQSSGGRWRRIYSGPVNVLWFGAQTTLNDGVLPQPAGLPPTVPDSNATAIQNAIDSIKATGGTVFFPAGTYWVSKPIRLKQPAGTSDAYNNITLEGVGKASQLKAFVPIGDPDTLGLLGFMGGSSYALKNIGIRKMRISGYDEQTLTADTGSVCVLIGFVNVSGSFVIDCHIDTHPIEGLYWEGSQMCENVLITGNRATRVAGWNGTAWHGSAYNTNARNVTMTNNWAFEVGAAIEQTGSGIYANNTFEYCGKNNPLGGGSWSGAMLMESTDAQGRVVVMGNVIRYAASGISFSMGDGQVLITDNMIENCTMDYGDRRQHIRRGGQQRQSVHRFAKEHFLRHSRQSSLWCACQRRSGYFSRRIFCPEKFEYLAMHHRK